MPVRTSKGPSDYDSGITTLPATLTVLTRRPLRVVTVLLCNITDAKHTVTITDLTGAANARLSQYPLQARMTVPVDLAGVLMNGVQWQADAADSVNAQLLGEYQIR